MPPAATTVPLELQQIDCSNPTGTFGSSDGCFIGSSGGETGNLADDYAFATANHAAILELYSQDALLAYDPKFCDTSGGGMSCKNPMGSGLFDWFGADLSASTQYNFYKNAGQGTSGCSGTNCPYASAIETAHGPH